MKFIHYSQSHRLCTGLLEWKSDWTCSKAMDRFKQSETWRPIYNHQITRIRYGKKDNKVIFFVGLFGFVFDIVCWVNKKLFICGLSQICQHTYTGNRPESVEKLLRRSLADLNLSYVDLYLIHVPFGVPDNNGEFLYEPNGDIVLDLATDHVAIWKVYFWSADV